MKTSAEICLPIKCDLVANFVHEPACGHLLFQSCRVPLIPTLSYRRGRPLYSVINHLLRMEWRNALCFATYSLAF